jgi:hypothetical protein
MGGTIPSLPLYAFMVYTGTTLPLTTTKILIHVTHLQSFLRLADKRHPQHSGQ